MDIAQLIFPFIMAVITNSIMIVAIYFLRKIPYFANLFSVWFMIALYLLGILRVFLPLEFPNAQIIIRDKYIYNFLIESMSDRVQDIALSPTTAFYVIVGAWAIGAVIFAAVSVYIHRSKRTYYLANFDFTTDEEKHIFNTVAAEILGDGHKVILKKTDAVGSIMVIGYFKKYILLPLKDYSSDELDMILRHECTHIRNRDLWLKLLIHIYCCVFWWNPFSYLLKHDLDFTLEMRCDLSVTVGFDDDERERYFTTLIRNCRQKNKKEKNQFFLCAELSDDKKNKEFVRRMRAITGEAPKKLGQAAMIGAISLLFVAIIAVSYLFILQPFYSYDAAEDNYDLDDSGTIIDDTNSYLVKQDDGSYLFYYSNFPPEVISKEEVESGMYRGFPIYDK